MAPPTGTAPAGGLEMVAVESTVSDPSSGGAVTSPASGSGTTAHASVAAPVAGADTLSPLSVEALDEGSRYALEHSGLGPSDLIVDCVGLVLAAFVIAAARALDHQVTDGQTLIAFLATFARLAVCVPVLAAMLTSTRRRSLLHPGLSDQVHALALPLAAGGMVALALWRVASGVLGVLPPRLDWLLGMCVLSLTTVAGARVVYHRLHGEDPTRVHRVLIVGSGAVADRVANEMAQNPGVEVVGCVDDDPVDPARCLGPLAALSDLCDREDVRHVVVAFSRSQPHEIIEALRPLQGRLPITVVPRLFEVLPATAKMHELGAGLAGLSVAPAALGPWPRAVKRTLDVAVAGLGLLVLSPVLALVALGIRLTSPGPVLFRQERVGRNGRRFSILKFRTMQVDGAGVSPAGLEGEPVPGPFPKLKDDPRVTPLGRLLRSTSVDEFPQLWNVLRGEMALVGPRPFMLEDAVAIDGWALRRYSVRPGITGLWQVSGRNELTFSEMCRLDQLYVNCWSIGLDLRILFRTLWVVLRRHGAY